HDDADGRLEPESQWKQERHAGKRAKPRQHTDYGSPQATDEGIGDPLPGKSNREHADELVQSSHLTSAITSSSTHQDPAASETATNTSKKYQHAVMPTADAAIATGAAIRPIRTSIAAPNNPSERSAPSGSKTTGRTSKAASVIRTSRCPNSIASTSRLRAHS